MPLEGEQVKDEGEKDSTPIEEEVPQVIKDQMIDIE